MMEYHCDKQDPSYLPRTTSPPPAFAPYMSSRSRNGTSRVRPQPPTPASGRGEYKGLYSDFASMAETQNRRKSLSSIPRRSTDPYKAPKSCLAQAQLLTPEKARRPHPRYSSKQPAVIREIPCQEARLRLSQSESVLPELEDFESLEEALQGSSTSSIISSESVGLPILSSNIGQSRCTETARPQLGRSITYDTFVAPTRSGNLQQSSSYTLSRSCNSDARTAIRRTRSPYPSLANDSARSMSSFTISVHSSYIDEKNSTSEYDIDPRFVFVAQPTQYWLGRYTTQLDKLRTCELISMPSDRHVSPKTRTSTDFDRIESRLKLEALSALRSFCRTKNAKDSFEQFIADLRHKDHDLWYASRSEFWKGIQTQVPNTTPASVTIPQNDMELRSQKFGETFPHGIFRKPIASSSRRRLNKSATLSNLAYPVDDHRPLRLSQQHQEQRKPSLVMSSMSTHVKDHKMRAVSDETPQTLVQFARLKSPIRPGLVTSHTEPSLTTKMHKRTAEMTLPRSFIPVCSPTLTVKLTNADSGDLLHTDMSKQNANAGTRAALPDSTAVASSRRFKKSESMKKLVDASIREIKKMGRRSSHSGTSVEEYI